METKDALITLVIRQLMRVAKQYSRVEVLPIPVAPGIDITTAEAHTIQAIGQHKQMSVTEVAAHFGITKSAASQMAARLTAKGFLEKKQSPHSNKELELSLTQLGWRAFRAHETFHGKDMAQVVRRLSAFSSLEIANASALLEAMSEVMERRLSRDANK